MCRVTACHPWGRCPRQCMQSALLRCAILTALEPRLQEQRGEQRSAAAVPPAALQVSNTLR